MHRGIKLQQLIEAEDTKGTASDTVPASTLPTVVNIEESLPGQTNLTTAFRNCPKEAKFNSGLNNNDENSYSTNNNDISHKTLQQLNSDYKVKKKSRNSCRRYLGIGLGLCSCMAFSLAVLIAKALPQYHQFSLTLWRFVGVFVFSFPILIYYQITGTKSLFEPLWPLSDAENRKTFLSLKIRGIVGAAAVALQFWSLKYISVADCTVISFSTPVFVTFLAFFVLGEKCGVVPVLAGFLTIGGVVVITRPPFLTGAVSFDYDLMFGTILALGTMACSTVVFVLLRFLRKLHFAIVTTSFGFVGVVECLILCASVSRLDLPVNGWDWFIGSSIGILAFLGQLCLTAAIKFESAGTISLVRTCDVIFAFIWQLIFLNVIPDSFSLIGASIVVIGVLIVGFRKWLDELPESNRLRQILWFVLK